MSRSWDVFCRVVDNYGDAAVCWRLASQLASEQHAQVRLWIDDLAALHPLCPEVLVDADGQTVSGVEVCRWTPSAAFGTPAGIVIEAFGCGLPETYVHSMAQTNPRPVWIVLEYLSAEAWVREHHLLPSPHPRLPLQRHFFFPGFVPGTGGVLREATLEDRREAFQHAPEARARYWRTRGFTPPAASALCVSLFGYENPAAADWLGMWAAGGTQVVLAVPPSRLRPQVCEFFGSADPGDGQVLRRGNLEVRLIAFAPQPAYDELLWACDLNFVRGEDSFVRAQWARRPLVWQIYPQKENAHALKLDAFLGLYCAGLDSPTADVLRRLWHGWNGLDPIDLTQLQAAWQRFILAQDALREHSRRWALRLAQPGNLAANLAQYCEERLK